MAANETGSNRTTGNLMDELLEVVRKAYVEKHGEEPSEAFLENARQKIIRTAGKERRDEHREIYDALAQE